MFRITKPKRPVTKVVIHYTATDSAKWDDIEVCRAYHMKERGYSDIGYHFYIAKTGAIQFGRDLEKIPAAQKGKNEYTIAVCLNARNHYTKAQKEALIELSESLNHAYSGSVEFEGHKDMANTECPGKLDYKKLLNLNEKGKMMVEKKEVRESLKESRTIQGGAIAGTAITAATVAELIDAVSSVTKEANEVVDAVSGLSGYGPVVMGLVAMAGIGYMIYARIDDFRKGIR